MSAHVQAAVPVKGFHKIIVGENSRFIDVMAKVIILHGVVQEAVGPVTDEISVTSQGSQHPVSPSGIISPPLSRREIFNGLIKGRGHHGGG